MGGWEIYAPFHGTDVSRLSVITNQVSVARSNIPPLEQCLVDGIVRARVQHQRTLMQQLPPYTSSSYRVRDKYFEYFERLESTYPGMLKLIQDQSSDSFDVSSVTCACVFGELTENTWRLLVALLVLEIYEKMEDLRFAEKSYGRFQRALEALTEETPGRMHRVMLETMRVRIRIAADVSLNETVRWGRRLWGRLTTSMHKRFFWYLQVRPHFIGMYVVAREKGLGGQMIRQIVEWYKDEMKDPQMRLALDKLVQCKRNYFSGCGTEQRHKEIRLVIGGGS